MFLWIYDDKYAYQYPLNEMSEEITIDGFHFSLMKVRRGYLLSSSFYHLRTYLQVNQTTNLTVKGHAYFCLLLQCHRDFKSYHHYAFTKSLTFGSDEKNDVVFCNAMIAKFQFSCNPDTKEIQVFSSKPITALNGSIIYEHTTFQIGDVLSFDTYRIIFMPHGMMMNYADETHVHLQVFTNALIESKLYYPCEKVRYYSTSPLVEHKFSMKLKDMRMRSDTNETRPLLLSTGPTLLMSLASLASGLLSAYQSYLNGRDFTSYLSVILLPGIMFISVAVLNPFIHFYDRRKRKQNYREHLKNYTKYMDSVIDEFNGFKKEYTDRVSEQFLSIEALTDHILNNSDQARRNCDLSVLTGYKTDVIDVNIEINQSDDKTVNDMIKEKMTQIHTDELYPWIIDLMEYKHVAIVSGRDQMQYFEHLLLEITYYFDIGVCLFTREDTIQKYPWLLEIPNIYFHNTRMIFQKWEDVPEYISQYKKPMIVIAFERVIPSNFDGRLIELLKEDSFNACDLLLDPSHDSFIDYKTKKQGQYTWNHTFYPDIRKCMYHLKNRKYDILKFDTDFFSVHQIEDMRDVDIREHWKKHSSTKSLQAYIGIDHNGERITLDLNEKKDGPHGLIAGMTGSGKSEMIISFLLSLAYRYSYEDVQFALIDFKGGGGSEILAGLPHVSSKLTNLDTSNMKRALISFHNECVYRQICIQRMNALCTCNIMNLSDYRNYWRDEYNLPKLADLIIVIDEFAELKYQHPEFMDDLISVSRIGRSLGIHLILCTQKPTGVINDEIWSNCSFKICLKVQDKQDSKQMIHCDDAIYLKQPGSFCLLAQDGLKKGLATYANAIQSISNTEVEILDEKGDVILSSNAYFEQDESEVTQMINKIQEACGHHTTRGLWLDPLNVKECGSMNGDVIGLIDDYYERRYIDLHLFEKKKRNILFVSQDHDEKLNCLNTILYACMNALSLDEEIFLFTDERDPHYENLKTYYRKLIEIISSNDHERWDNLMHHIKHSSSNMKILIFQDLSLMSQKALDDLHFLLEHADACQLYIIIFASNASALKYKDLSFIQRRLILLHEDLQDIQQILQTSEKLIQKKNCYGLCKSKHILEFSILKTPIEQLEKKAKAYGEQYGTDKPYRIPYMDEYISRKNYSGNEIPIGISYADYTWITCDPCKSMYVVSLYKEEWIRYYRMMKTYCKCACLKDKDIDDAQLIFLSLDEYRLQHDESLPVLYIGTSFSRQYTFYSKNLITQECDAIYFNNYESKKVRLL